MKQYQVLIKDVLENGTNREDRTGTGTVSLFGTQTRYDLRDGFPLVTVKKTFHSSMVKELLWFLRGETNISTLGCGIWDEWSQPDGELGPIYGAQWRKWQVPTMFDEEFRIDQISNLIQGLKENPLSRRHIVTAWNPAEIEFMALPPCHTMFQMYASEIPSTEMLKYKDRNGQVIYSVGREDPVGWMRGIGSKAPKYYLDLQLYQRSADLMLGVPFNIASYSLLLTLIAREVNMVPRFFIHTMGDAHIYSNHIDAAKEVLLREPLPLCNVRIADKPMPYPGCPRDGSVFEPEDIVFEGYESHPFIKLPVAV